MTVYVIIMTTIAATTTNIIGRKNYFHAKKLICMIHKYSAIFQMSATKYTGTFRFVIVSGYAFPYTY